MLEFCDCGDLHGLIQRQPQPLSEDLALHFAQQLALGLQYVRARGIIHRDLKPQNLLLASSSTTALVRFDKANPALFYQSLILKIADFGFARWAQPQSLVQTLCGSPLYMAPEVRWARAHGRAHGSSARARLWLERGAVS